MKTLLLMRHAKSSWEHEDLPDDQRPLNNRGERDIPKMGERLIERKLIPDMIISSPAERAMQTAKLIAPYLRLPSSRVVIADELYLADPDIFLSLVQLCDDNVDCLMLVGHNPGITQFANELTDTPIEHMPTAAVFASKFNIKHWHEISMGAGDYIAFEYPKKY